MALKKQNEMILQNRKWLVFFLVIAAPILIVLYLTIIKLTDIDMRRELLQNAQIVAKSINIERVKNLKGSPADLDAADYIRLKEQLISIRPRINECLYLYILGQNKEGMVFFFIDVGNGGDAAKPGDIYEDIPKGYLTVFETANAHTQGPYTDKWGTFVSAGVPLFETQSENLIAVLGIDIDAEAWRWRVLYRAKWFIIGLVLMFAFLLGLLIKLFISLRQQRHASQNLQVEKYRYESIIEGTNVGTWEWNVKTGETIFNEKFVGMAGYTLEELSPTSFNTWALLAHPDDLMASNDALEKHFRGETEFYETECRVKHKDGHWVWILDRGKVISWTEERKPLWVYGTHTDITSRKYAEEALAMSEVRFRTLFNQSRDAVMTLDPPLWKFTSGNPAIFKLYGVEEIEAFTQLGPWDVSPEYQPDGIPSHVKAKEMINKAMREGSNFFEWTHMRLDGSQFSSTVLLSRIENSGHGYLQAVVRDISDQKRAIEALRESERKARAILDLSFQFIGLLSPDGILLDANRAALEVVGVSQQDVLNKPFCESPWWNHSVELQNKLHEAIKSASAGEEIRFEASHPALDGSLRYVDFSLRPVKNEQGDVIYLIPEGHDITERKTTEEELRISRDQFQSLVNNMPGITYRCKYDEYWTIIYISSNIDSITGYSADELINNAVTSYGALTHPEDNAMAGIIIAEAIANERAWEVEYRVLHKDGLYRWAYEKGQAIKNNKGEVLFLDGLILNITQRKQAENERNESKKMLELVMGSIPQFIFWKDCNSVYLGCNKNFALVAGLNSASEIVGKTDYDLPWNKKEADFFVECDQRVIRSGTPEYHIIEPQMQADGKRAWLDTNKVPICNESGCVVGILGSYEDITDRILAEEQIIRARQLAEESERKTQQLYYELQTSEEEIRASNEELSTTNDALSHSLNELEMAKEKAMESEEMYRGLLQTVPDIIVRTDLDGNIVFINDIGTKIIGSLSQAEILGRNMFSFISEEDKERAAENTRLMFQDHLGVKEYRLVLDGEDFIDAEVNGEVVRDKNGNPKGMVYTIRDVTERKLAEKERQQKSMLEKKIAVAEESLKFKQNFLANMSHEIRTPLTGVLGMIDILGQTSLTLDQKDYLDTIKASGENLREIINQVLDYSKIEAGKATINPAIFEFKCLPENTGYLFKNNLRTGVKLHNFIESKIPAFIEADKSRLSQVLNNLVSNAVKFTSLGTITIQSSLISYDTDNGRVVIKIEVTDTGIGIPNDLQERLFIPFSQIEALDTRHYEGTGLGLSICRQLIEMMGGQSGLLSEEGKGSTFWFTFPALIAQAPEAITREISENTSNRPLRILLAEDKAVNQKVIKLMLKAMGHEVEIVSDGQQALEHFEPGKFDLILMDIQMPVMDGITATQKLKQTHTMLPPIVGLSANAFEGDREKYMALGMDEYLTKPVKEKDFQHIINKKRI